MSAITEQAVKIAILQALAERARAHKSNLIGSRGYPGPIDVLLQKSLSDDERWRVGRAFDELRRAGLIRPDLQPSASPSDDWVVLSDSGREALQRGHLDELDRALARVSSTEPDLVQIRAGASLALSQGTPEAAKQSAHSARELIDKLLHVAAPDELVNSSPGFVPDPQSRNGVTRRHRLRCVLSARSGGLSESDLQIVEAQCDVIEATHKKLTGLAHSASSVDVSESRELLATVESALRRLLGVRERD